MSLITQTNQQYYQGAQQFVSTTNAQNRLDRSCGPCKYWYSMHMHICPVRQEESQDQKGKKFKTQGVLT